MKTRSNLMIFLNGWQFFNRFFSLFFTESSHKIAMFRSHNYIKRNAHFRDLDWTLIYMVSKNTFKILTYACTVLGRKKRALKKPHKSTSLPPIPNIFFFWKLSTLVQSWEKHFRAHPQNSWKIEAKTRTLMPSFLDLNFFEKSRKWGVILGGAP